MRIVLPRAGAWTPPGVVGRPAAAGAFLLGLFAALTLLVGQRLLEPMDLALMNWVQSVSGAGLDALAGVLNYAAAGEVVLAAAALGSVWLLRRGVPVPAAAAPLVFLGALPIELLLEYTLDQPVPSELFYRRTLAYDLLSLPTMESYPSGHVLRAAFVAVLVGYVAWRLCPSRMALLTWTGLAAFVLLCAWCRVYQGHHWPMDVLGGGLLGAAAGCFAVSLLGPVLPRRA